MVAYIQVLKWLYDEKNLKKERYGGKDNPEATEEIRRHPGRVGRGEH